MPNLSNKTQPQCLLFALALMLGLAACGSAEEVSSSAEADPAAVVEEQGDEEQGDEDEDDHDDEHDDEHGDDDQNDSSGLGAHEHGAADLSVAWIGTDVVVDMISPTQNVFGFEYEPETEEDLATAAERTKALTTDGIVAVNAEADCTLLEPATTEIEREASHSEVTVSWAFTCANPDQIESVDLTALFAEFPGFEDIDAEWISESDQSGAELSPDQPTLRLTS